MFNRLNTSKLNRYIFIDLIGLSLLIYTLTLAPTVLMADAGEFQFVAWLPGIAHPPGYPLYILLGWFFSHLLSFGEVAWRLNFFSAVSGAVAVGLVYLTSQEVTTRLTAIPLIVHRLIAASTALIFAFSHTFWSQVIIAEVYGLHALFVAFVLWAALRLTHQEHVSEVAPSVRLPLPWVLCFVVGLSLTHHRTMVLMIPALIAYLWVCGWRKIATRQVIWLVLVTALPSLLYLYLPLIAPRVPYTQFALNPEQSLILYENTPRGFSNHVMGRAFVGELRPADLDETRLLMVLEFLRQQVGWVGGALGLLGLITLIKNPALMILTLGSFLGFLAFNLIYFVGDIVVFFIPCWLIFSLWIGIGGLSIVRFVSFQIVLYKRARPLQNPTFLTNTAKNVEENIQQILLISLSALLLVLPVTLLISRYPEIDQSKNTLARDAWLEILGSGLPENAILISNDRNEIMPMWYFQYVEAYRSDLLGLFPLITPDPAFENVGRLLDQALASKRPVFLVKPMPGLEIKADLTLLPPLPHAQLVQVTMPNQKPDQSVALSFEDQLFLTGYDQLQTSQNIAITLYWQMGQAALEYTYTSFVHLVDSEGNRKAQSQDHPPGGVYYPSLLWQPQEQLRDEHRIHLPDNLASGEYTLVAGLYRQPKPGQLIPLGQAQKLGVVIIE